MSYYPRIRDLREDEDLSQQQLAEILHLNRSQYQRYESGYRSIPVDILIKLANFYQTSTDYILRLSDVRKPYPKRKP